jgi:hypothetical protein
MYKNRQDRYTNAGHYKISTRSEDCTGLTRLMEGFPQRVKGQSGQWKVHTEK